LAEAPTRRRPDSTRRLVFRVAQLCGAVRDILSARRVSVLIYSPSSRTVSPLVSDHHDDERLRELGRKWSRVPLDDFPAARTVLLGRQSLAIEDAQRDVRLPPGVAADFGVTSVHLEPLVTTEPVGVLAIEPAVAADSQDLQSIVPLVAASVGRILARRKTEGGDDRGSDFVVELMEAAAQERSVEGVLAIVCERLARRVGARRGCAFLLDEDRLVPRAARFADGSRDQAAWEQFRTATTPLPLADAALQSGEPVVAEDRESSLIEGWWADTFAVGSALAAPLGRPGAVIGVVALESPDQGHFSHDDASLAAEAAARLGGIVAGVLAIEERTSNLRAATAIRRLLEEGSRALSVEEAAETLARVTRDALAAEHASVFLAGPEDRIGHVAVDAPEEFKAIARERLVGSVASDFRLWRRVTRQQQPIFIEDASESQLIPAELVALLRLRSYVAFPLLATDRALGIVVCSDTRESRHWPPEQRQLVEQLALEGSLVIENAALRATERRRIGELAQQAFHDSLTELPNRALFADRLEHALARTRRGQQSVAVLLLDLDGFKQVNDSFGHEAGDQLLVAVAQRLRACLRPADTVARLGGDEFTILLEDIAHLSEATRVAERIEASLRTPFVVDGNETGVTTSIGIAFNDPGQSLPSDLLRNADAAMYEAKHGGKGRYQVFSPSREPRPLGDLGLRDELSIKSPSITGKGRHDPQDVQGNDHPERDPHAEDGDPLAPPRTD
jgi:diguanylate cyclase (GGDEF)-like protein